MRFAIKRSATWPRLRITLNRSLSRHERHTNTQDGCRME